MCVYRYTYKVKKRRLLWGMFCFITSQASFTIASCFSLKPISLYFLSLHIYIYYYIIWFGLVWFSLYRVCGIRWRKASHCNNCFFVPCNYNYTMVFFLYKNNYLDFLSFLKKGIYGYEICASLLHYFICLAPTLWKNYNLPPPPSQSRPIGV